MIQRGAGMRHRHIRGAITGLIVAGATLIALPSTGAGAVGPCSPTATQTITGPQTSAFKSTLPDNVDPQVLSGSRPFAGRRGSPSTSAARSTRS